MSSEEFLRIPVGHLRANPFNPRRTFDPSDEEDALKIRNMAESIKKDGVIQPIIVRRKGKLFEVAAGERRRRASEIAGAKTVPAMVREIDDAAMRRFALIENLHRLDMTPIEKEQAFGRIWEEDYEDGRTVQGGRGHGVKAGTAQMARDFGMPHQTLNNYVESYRLKKEGKVANIGKLSPHDVTDLARVIRAAPRAADILAGGRASGALDKRRLQDAVTIVNRAPKERKESVARGIVDAADERVKFIAKEEGASFEEAEAFASGGAPQTIIQIQSREDNALLRRVATFREEAARLGIDFLGMFKDPSSRGRAIAALGESARLVRETTEAAKEPSRIREWDRKWADFLENAQGTKAIEGKK